MIYSSKKSVMQKIQELRYLLAAVSIVCLLLFLSFRNPDKRANNIKSGVGDTTAFTVNTSQGWGLYNSYLEKIGDSVEFELILFRNTPGNNNWSNDSEVGTIKNEYAPSGERTINYQQLPRRWLITIKPDGKCLFRLLSGPEPESSAFVLPVQTKYQK
jgi:hypothetical protein